MPSGGTLKEFTVNHPTLGQLFFDPKSGEDSTYVLGGVTSVDEAMGITASGRMIDTQNVERWSFECVLTGSPGDGTLENLKALQANTAPGTVVATNINGQVYRGLGKPVGDISMNGMNSTINVKFAGGGILQVL